ncbi:hypothetical protein [Nostoc sp.]|uniref:hypothetical protein n=1 Tax=Nostoc sp. TaxID=1180 RepID=UPI002FFA6457
MTLTVQELIEKLQAFPADSVIAFEDLEDDQEFFLVSLNPGDNRLTIVISGEDLEEEEEG